MKSPKTRRKRALTASALSTAPEQQGFAEVVEMIQAARGHALAAVNTALINLYWRVGEYISRRIGSDGWGKGTVTAPAAYIQKQHPGLRSFSPQNLWRMRQFFDTYREQPDLSPLVRELPWTHNLIILGQSKRAEEREFSLRLAIRERWSKRELERQLASALFERAVLNPPKAQRRCENRVLAPRRPFATPTSSSSSRYPTIIARATSTGVSCAT